MKLPNPSPFEYAARTALVVLTVAVVRYTGVFLDDPGGIDPVFLALVAVTYPAFSYLLAVLAANADRGPE
ncbi:hypothetical protein [Halorubrum sp. Boch-26]|uniref:hypothetical protein n=1 Tax=Halorubrum sp. Boch-26 TaxID=2994426 RepID=UPI00246881CA|nr:hypothetical protein [Halorubrum sp. Boch-26]